MLLRIRLINWRSHADSEIKFSAGANLFLGPMGSGKSSVMDALCFALYGTYPKLNRRDAAMDDISNFRHRGKPTSVEVEWSNEEITSQGGRNSAYLVRREFPPAQAWLYADGKLLQKGPKAVSDEVEKILQIPYELFSRAVYAEQNRLDYWLSLPAGSRKAELDRLLGLDLFEKARRGAGEQQNKMRERAQALEAASPQAHLDAARAELAKQQAELAKKEGDLESAQKKLAQTVDSLAAAHAKYSAAEALIKKRDELEGRRQKLFGSTKSLQEAISLSQSLQTADEIAKSYASARAERAELESKSKALQSERQKIAQAIGKFEAMQKAEQARGQKLLQLKEKLALSLEGKTEEQLKTQVAAMQTSISELIAAEARIEGEIKDARKIMLAFEVSAGGEELGCPVCKHPLSELEKKRLKNEQEARLSSLAKSQSSIISELSSLRKALEHGRVREAEATRLASQILALGDAADLKQIEAELASLRHAQAQAGEQLGALADLLSSCQKRESAAMDAKNKLEQSQRLGLQLKRELAELEAVKESLAAIKFSEKEWSEIKSERESLMRAQAGEAEHAKACASSLSTQKVVVSTSAKRVMELESLRAQALSARKEMDELSVFRSVLSSTQMQMRTLMIGEINSAMEKLWPLVYPYSDWARVRLVADERDYCVQIFQGEWKDLEAHASGGERACLGLALRASLSIILTPQLGWLILDEPTHNLDLSSVQSLGRAISERIPKIIPQIIVITHDSALLESTPARTLRFERDKGAGEDTKIVSDD